MRDEPISLPDRTVAALRHSVRTLILPAIFFIGAALMGKRGRALP